MQLIFGSVDAIACHSRPNFSLISTKSRSSTSSPLRKSSTVDKDTSASVAKACGLGYPYRWRADLTC